MDNIKEKMSSTQLIIPERLQLETVHGCNARCTMCPIHLASERKKGIMSFELFKYIVDKMIPFKENITKFDLWGLGEPLLDKNIASKIRYAKDKGFQNLAIATNVDLLNSEIVTQLYQAKLDTILFSIDGVTKQTHESIRINTNFERVIENANNAIKIRNENNYKTRFVFRFIRQEKNKNEWQGFKEYWKKRISKKYEDIIICYNRHTWGGELKDFVSPVLNHNICTEKPCHHIFDRLIILWDGTVPLCCSDLHHAHYCFGNVKDISPVDLFNCKKFQKIRYIHNSGKRMTIKICKECTILESEMTQEIK